MKRYRHDTATDSVYVYSTDADAYVFIGHLINGQSLSDFIELYETETDTEY